MYLLGKRVDTLNESDIKRLLESQISESKNLDYKRDLNLSGDKNRKEFLFDVSAMYNTDGGSIIFGIEELKDEKNQNTGIPSEVTGIEIENFDKVIQSIEDLVKNCSEPSIAQLVIKELNFEDKSILILGIPKSLGLPSMVTFKKTNKFYKRRNSGKYAVDVYELNQMFMQNQVLKEKVNDFRKERIKKVLALDVLPNIDIQSAFFIHIIPFGFLDYQFFDFSIAKNNLLTDMKPLNASGWNSMFNIDGFATFSSTRDRGNISSYNQIFRSGVYEVYSSDLFYEESTGKAVFNGNSFINNTLELIEKGLSVLNKMQIEPPFLISFSFHNVRGKAMYNGRVYYQNEFKQNEIIFPLIQVPTYEANVYNFMKPNFDILWQSLGFPSSPDIK